MYFNKEKRAIVGWFIGSIIFSLLLLTFVASIHLHYGGPIGTENYETGFDRIYLGHPLSILSRTLSIILVSSKAKCVQFSFNPCKFSFGLIIIFIVYALDGLCLFHFFHTIFNFGEAGLDPGQMSRYVQAYFKKHHEAPPFLDYYQTKFGGSCCGAIGPEDYGHIDALTFGYLDVPSSCCFNTHKWSTNHNECGKGLWGPLMSILNNSVPATVSRVDGGRDQWTESMRRVFIDEASTDAPQEFSRRRPSLEQDLWENFEIFMPHLYDEIVSEAIFKFPHQNGTNQNISDDGRRAFIWNRTMQESSWFMDDQMNKLKNLDESLVFVPYGCGPFIRLAVFGHWQGFQDQEATMHLGNWYKLIFYGLLAMALAALGIGAVNIILVTRILVMPRSRQRIDRDREKISFEDFNDDEDAQDDDDKEEDIKHDKAVGNESEVKLFTFDEDQDSGSPVSSEKKAYVDFINFRLAEEENQKMKNLKGGGEKQ